jgi:hypothetical protein
MVLDTLFGVNVSLDDLRVESRLAQFDPKAELRGFRYQDKTYVISSNGAHISR